jgi:hypothetical protein
MAHRSLASAAVALLAAATWIILAGDARAQGYGPPGWVSPEPNYYAMPASPEGPTAALYPSPLPTPPLIGQTYITYEPLAPHEFLYLHHQCYKTVNGCGQVTRTSVTYGHHHCFHPSLVNPVPGLHTPAYGCRF